MTGNPKADYFDGIADRWDGWEDLEHLAERLAEGLARLGVGEAETILDVGCGTGNLTRALLGRLSPAGRVVAVDISPRMIDTARRKVTDERVIWHEADVVRLPLEDASLDRVICFSVWPHVSDRVAAACEIRRVLRPGGRLHVWHLIGRAQVNEIHAGAGEPVRHDVLGPADETARLLADAGFSVDETVDVADRYLVTAVRPED